jgi:hypothetical protein
LSESVTEFAVRVAELEAAGEDDGEGGPRDDTKLAQA